MVSIFRKKSPGNIVLLLIFGLILKMPLFIFPKTITATQNDGTLYHNLLQLLNAPGGNNAMICALLSFFILYGQALMVNYLVNEFRLLPKPNYLPAMAYLLLTSLLPEWNYLSSPLVATTFMLWIFARLFTLYNVTVARGTIFNIGLALGLSSYIYFPAASFMICILPGLFIIKPFRLNEVVLFLLGCLTPYYFDGAYLFLNNRLNLANFLPHLSLWVPQVRGTIWLAASLLLITIPFLAGGYFVQLHLTKTLIQVRKAWSIMLLYLLLSFFVPFVNSTGSFSNWVLIAAPFACFHASCYYYPVKRWLVNSLFFITAGFIFYLQYATLFWRTSP